MNASRPPTRFSRPRFALLVLLGAYPVITGLLYFVLPTTAGWPIWQRTLLVAPMMVGAMVYGVIPIVQRRFARFLNPPVKDGATARARGTAA